MWIVYGVDCNVSLLDLYCSCSRTRAERNKCFSSGILSSIANVLKALESAHLPATESLPVAPLLDAKKNEGSAGIQLLNQVKHAVFSKFA